MRLLLCLQLVFCCVLIGCNAGESSVGAPSDVAADDGGSERPAPAMSLEPGDLEKLGNWDATSQASAKLTEMLANIMAEVKDKETATQAIPKLRDLAPRFAAVNRAEEALGVPSDADRKLVLQNLASANKKFDEFYTPLSENEELKAIVGQAIDDAYVGNVTE